MTEHQDELDGALRVIRELDLLDHVFVDELSSPQVKRQLRIIELSPDGLAREREIDLRDVLAGHLARKLAEGRPLDLEGRAREVARIGVKEPRFGVVFAANVARGRSTAKAAPLLKTSCAGPWIPWGRASSANRTEARGPDLGHRKDTTRALRRGVSSASDSIKRS